jgi:phospholipid transport system substrate-binding protein
MMIRHFGLLVPALLAFGLLSSTAQAGAASDVVRAKQTRLFATVAKPKNAARQAALRRLFDEMLDYQAFAKAALGKQWAKRSEAERKRFSALLERLVRNNYRRNLKKMLDYRVSYVSEQTTGDTTLVRTAAKHKTDQREPELQIDFRLAQVGQSYKVVDIVTENASMVRTYRSQFLRIIRKKGFDKLIEKLEKKLAK